MWVCRVGWQGALSCQSARMAAPCKEKQRGQAARQARNRVRSGLTQPVSLIEGANLNIQKASRGRISGQLRNQG